MFYKLPSINVWTAKLVNCAAGFRGKVFWDGDFQADERGTIATTLGLALIPVMLSAGIAVDYTRIAHTKGIVGEALDAAVLMSGNALSEGQSVNSKFRKNFEDFFYANINGRTKMAKKISIVSFSANATTGKISASARSNVKMAFMGIIGKSNVDVLSKSEASVSAEKIELSMMLDVTGSMGTNGKLDALKTAAKDAIDILMPTSSTNNKMRISLVPYSASVNVGYTTAKLVSNNSGNKCVTERFSNKFNDASFFITKVEGIGGNCPTQEVRPLSSSPSSLKKTIDGFMASGATAGHLGVAWSYYTLSPNWTKAWRSSRSPASYADKNVKKIALLMTDGEFNTIYTNGWTSSDYAKSICADMKKKGIIVYSIAFQAPTSARDTLRNCASADNSNTTYYYSATNANDLKVAFKNIANDIKRLRLSL